MMKNISLLNLLVLLYIFNLIGLAGCSNNAYRHYIPNRKVHCATKQALQYLKLAGGTSDENLRNSLLLAGAELLIEVHDYLQAAQLLKKIDRYILNNSEHAMWHILQAKIKLTQKDFSKAKSLLSNVNYYSHNNLDEEIYRKFYLTKVDLFLQSGDIIEAVQAKIKLEKFLATQVEINNNNKSIWHQLQQLTSDYLELANLDNFDYKMQGWINIAIITKKYATDNDELTKAISVWQDNFPNHPANNVLNLPEKRQSSNSNYKFKRATKIALLLPVTGAHQNSGLAIKNGFLAALYSKKSTYKKPNIIVLDTNERSIIELYKNAIEKGADFIIGPLLKQELESLTRSDIISVPTLALNQLPDNKLYSKLLFQFGLPGEVESLSIVNKAWSKHHKNALLIVQNNDTGKKMASHLTFNWQEQGGDIIDVIQIDNNTDLSLAIKKALGVEESELRAKALKSLAINFNFEPRRRQDLDCIFLVTNANFARQIKPLLNFYYAKKIPIYASSNIYIGAKNTLDRDLDDIKFCDMPWMLDKGIQNKMVYQSIKSLWGKNFTQYARLYALGVDSYNLSNQLQQLLDMREIGLSGMTGILKIDDNNVISRQLTWGIFTEGEACIVTS